MSDIIRLALAGLNQTPMDWKGNMARIRRAWRGATDKGAGIICFPELAVSGYGCEDMFLHPDTAARSLKLTAELALEVKDQVLLVGLPFFLDGKLFNGLAVLNRGKIRGIAAKSHLARDGIHYEPRWFTPWSGNLRMIKIDGRPVPVGPQVFRANHLNFALEICEDAWVAPEERPCRLARDAQWVFNASASHFSMRKAGIRERILCDTSERFKVGYAYANLVGCESGRAIYDGELLVAEGGVITNRSDRLYLDDARLLFHDLENEPGGDGWDTALRVEMPGPLPEIDPPVVKRKAEPHRQEFALAASLALFDYMRKSRSNGFTLSLSGGVDSSVVAVLVWIMAQRVLSELSLEERRSKLSWFKGLPLETQDPRVLTRALLTTVYQATRNSGPVTREAASKLSEAIGARHLELDVDSLVSQYTALVSESLGRELSWDADDVALQNIQARVRGPGVWMMANLNRSLLLSTSNRSEVAVGYATMDGDTCGGLAPIAGVEKTFLRHWLAVMETEGFEGIPPLPALVYVNRQQPTAELRPPSETQTDEDDLMPYEVLDALEEALISKRMAPREAFEDVAAQFNQISRDQIREWTRKFCRMFAMVQWKRERYAPAFHLDDCNLDPKTWARYPILSGAFEAELEEL